MWNKTCILLLEYRTPIPFQKAMHVVVGRPIELEKNPRPTVDEVNNFQNFLYIICRNILRQLWKIVHLQIGSQLWRPSRWNTFHLSSVASCYCNPLYLFSWSTGKSSPCTICGGSTRAFWQVQGQGGIFWSTS